MEVWSFEHLNKIQIAGTSAKDLRQLNAQHPERYPFLLQSTANNNVLGQFDILFAFPGASLCLDQTRSLVGVNVANHDGFLDALSAWWRDEYSNVRDVNLPFVGGWFLYLGYELAGEVEPSLSLHTDSSLPVAFAVRCPNALIYDHQSKHCYYISEKPDYNELRKLQHDLTLLDRPAKPMPSNAIPIREDQPDDFLAAVEKAKESIAAGDIYQANLSREWRAMVPTEITPAAIFDSLSAANPAPFAGIAYWQETAIISSSPERLLAIRDGVASTRPIAGTRPRADKQTLDASLSAELFAHPKERAEHIMLIDLERNDLGRVCKPGSVEVDEMMVLESYAHVHHIVSNVRGDLRDDVGPAEVIAAVFPGGTITGCPKVRCMQLINDLETTARGAYTGSFGYLNRNGDLDLNILIRTMVMHGQSLTLRAGAGIVADSDPRGELKETRAKAKGLLAAMNTGGDCG